MSDSLYKPGDWVRHVGHNHKEHDRWRGLVIGYDRPIDPLGKPRIAVRWIKPCGDPSSDIVSHESIELKPEVQK